MDCFQENKINYADLVSSITGRRGADTKPTSGDQSCFFKVSWHHVDWTPLLQRGKIGKNKLVKTKLTKSEIDLIVPWTDIQSKRNTILGFHQSCDQN